MTILDARITCLTDMTLKQLRKTLTGPQDLEGCDGKCQRPYAGLSCVHGLLFTSPPLPGAMAHEMVLTLFSSTARLRTTKMVPRSSSGLTMIL